MANKLVLELIADSNNLLKAMEQSQKSINNFVRGSEAAGQSLGGGVNQALDAFMGLSKGGALAAGVFAGALVAAAGAATMMAVEAGRQAEELQQLSAVMGIGTDTLQEYDVLLNRVGLGGQDLTLVMKSLSTKMEEAKTGTGAAADRFRQLGIDITKVTGTDDLIRKIAESVSKFSNGTEKAAVMADLLGKSGLKFIPAFEGGAAAIDEAAAASKRMGATLSSVQIETLGKMDDSIDDLGISWKRFSQQIGAFFAPAVEMAVNALSSLLSWGSHVFEELGTASATLGIRFTAMGQAFMEVASQVFSAQIFNGAAWAQTLENIKRIDAEAAKLIEQRRALAQSAGAADGRGAAPALIDSAKVAAAAQSAADAQLKASESLFRGEEALAQARLANFLSYLDTRKAMGTATEVELAQAHEAAAQRMADFTIDSLEKQLRNYEKYTQAKLALFGADEKSQAEKHKFEIEAGAKVKDLLKQIEIAQVKSDTTRLQSSTKTALAMKKETDSAFQRMLEVEEQTHNLQFGPATISEGMKAHEAAVENLIRLMPELNHHEAALQVMLNQQSAHDSIVAATEAYKDRNKELEFGVEYARADSQLQQAWYSQAPGLIGQATAAREKGFELLQAESDMRRQVIDETIFDEERKGAAIYALDQELQAKRINLLNQFPTFWEQQLQAIVSSNAFSLSSITSNFNNATAQWIQGQGNFTQFWEQTQTTLLTSALQFTEQWLVQLALSQLRELAMVTTQEATKTALTTAGATSRVAVNAASDGAIVASNATAATASVGIWGGATAAILGFFATIGAGFAAVIGSLVAAVVAVGTFIMGVLSAIASALSATVFGIPFAGAIVVGIGLIAAALAMTDNLPEFKDGGIMTGPTIGKFAEAGSPEAAIPLNDRGAAFMQKAMGFGGGAGGLMTINLQLDGRTLAEATMSHMPG
ncbi:MAG: hypothetical protein H8K10_10700, partial [Nitrospira sp.]|nr:hypothetical protein [Nitrospira sp.]